MNRIHQSDPATATGKTKQLFDNVQKALGFVPNLMRVLGNSTAALEGYLTLNATLSHGVLPAPLRDQIALTVGEINGCGYCLSAHTLLGSKAGLDHDELLAARRATSVNDKSDAALKLARAVTLQRGHISDADLHAARSASLSDAEIVEVVQHVALNILTNYTNNVARTVIDFPEVKPGELELATASTHSLRHD
ncbi:MAG: carboxymuconolactone decarboxylase family protein [Chthoniobacteraceae bacterium]